VRRRRREGGVMGKRRDQTLASMDSDAVTQKLVRMYMPREEDVAWVRQCLIGTVINGESIPLIQR
jgi:hypothetical protein